MILLSYYLFIYLVQIEGWGMTVICGERAPRQIPTTEMPHLSKSPAEQINFSTFGIYLEI